LLSPLVDSGRLLLRGGDPSLGLLSGRGLALLGFGESFGADTRGFG
jgi:hypothetical protein